MRGARGAWGKLVASFAAIVVLAGCGGGERQDENEPSGSYTVDVVKADFPSSQHLSKPEELTIAVKNSDQKAIPNVAVTLDSFSTVSQEQGLADPQRPVWIVDDGPLGGTTAYTNTWALGPLKAGQTKTFKWHVTAIQPGTHTVKYRVAAGLNGKAKAQDAGGHAPVGSFTVNISGKPSDSKVDPDTGKVVREQDSDS